MDEFTDRLHERLRGAASGHDDRPTLDDIARRARRQRRRTVTIGSGVASVVLVVAAVAATLVPSPDTVIDLESDSPVVADRPATTERPNDPGASDTTSSEDDADAGVDQPEQPQQPEADEETTEDAATHSVACDTIDQIAMVVATIDQGLEAVCADGSTAPLTDEPQADHPVFTGDGTGVIYDDGSRMYRLDLRSGEVTDLGEGHMPALSADGRMAWLTGEEASPTLVVGQPGEVPESERFLGTMVVRSLAWEPEGEHVLVVHNAPGEGSLLVFDADDADQPPRAPAPEGGPAAARVAAAAAEVGRSWVGMAQPLGDRGLRIVRTRHIAGLEELSWVDGIDVIGTDPRIDEADPIDTSAAIWLADAHGMRRSQGDRGFAADATRSPKWLIGDGHKAWLASSTGLVLLKEDARYITANPVLRAAD